MPIPHVFLPIKRSDFTITPFQVHKKYTVSNADWSASAYTVRQGVFSSLNTPISSSKAGNDPRNTDGTFKHVIWQAINQRYYKFPHDPTATFEHSNRRFNRKEIFLTASILSAPVLDFGESFKKGTVEVTNSAAGIYLSDDGYGNLYDRTINTGSFAKRYNLIGYWGFQETYKATRYGFGQREKQIVPYTSHIFEPSEFSLGRNVYFRPGVKVYSPATASGIRADFNGSACIATHHRDEFDFAKSENFTLSFWIRMPISQSVLTKTTNSVISKRGTIRKQVYGTNPKYSANDLLIPTPHISASIENQSTNVYSYHVEVNNQSNSAPGRLVFKRSDGQKTVSLSTTSSLAGLGDKHIAITKNNSLISLYVDGTRHASGSDVGTEPLNQHMIIFGAENIDFANGFSGSLDEIRMYDYSVSSGELNTLKDKTNGRLYQTAAVGNAFYKNGTVVISSPLPKYNRVFDGTWYLKYRNTHTIYQYEVLCRVKKGQANLSMNPTARVSPHSDLFINEFTGSYLYPYVTTIGLYDEKGGLLAVGKLGQPIQMRSDVDINFLIRMDI